ncbi:MAG TPA: hypothetical protein VF662_06470 [Allosphingosinicella sp.]|jgi:hypothetical protein
MANLILPPLPAGDPNRSKQRFTDAQAHLFVADLLQEDSNILFGSGSFAKQQNSVYRAGSAWSPTAPQERQMSWGAMLSGTWSQGAHRHLSIKGDENG